MRKHEDVDQIQQRELYRIQEVIKNSMAKTGSSKHTTQNSKELEQMDSMMQSNGNAQKSEYNDIDRGGRSIRDRREDYHKYGTTAEELQDKLEMQEQTQINLSKYASHPAQNLNVARLQTDSA